jgi:metal transporter CNNM
LLFNTIPSSLSLSSLSSLSHLSSPLSCTGIIYKLAEQEQRDTGITLVLDLVVVLVLVIVAGIMSGLTLGLLSLDTVNLEIIINAGDAKDSENAKK